MKICKFLFVFLLICFSEVLFSQTAEVKLTNSGFEEKNGTTAEGWKAEPVTAKITTSAESHSGKYSLLMNNENYLSSTAYSGYINLKVGNLYKLTGWVKTEKAYTKGDAQYPTPVAACLTMESFPFTNSSQAVGATNNWQKIEVVFFATQSKDRVALHLGYNGPAVGKAWFDDVKLEEINDIKEFVPYETVKWYENAFRFNYKGWIYLHIEGNPYRRGFQYGYLVADEVKEFINKLAINKNTANPASGWNDERFMADALFLRKFDDEYLTEMKGIADGVNKAGIKIFGRSLDLIDIVAVNSSIDIDYAAGGLKKTPNPLTGVSFLSADEDQEVNTRLHKCSSFIATKSASKDGKIVFGQLFMWGGYTGPHWNIFVDVIPEQGNRLVYETFPGGISSGADFYINSKGIMIGETTVAQTPFNAAGKPQANRIRKAAQYANSIDDVVKIMTTDNNGLYTNDWLIGDSKNDEIALMVLGTNKYKVWKSSENDFYNGQKDWYFSNNNNKSLDVRKEYIVNSDNAPYDLTYRPMDRDLVFWNYYKNNHGNIDVASALHLLGSSPVNRPHACDGKVTTSEMAQKMVFLANYGKVTLRENFVNENGRIPDLPGAIPRLSLGYSVFSPIFINEKLQKIKLFDIPPYIKESSATNSLQDVAEVYNFDKKLLWHGTVYPASEKDNWINSSSAAYWNLLNSQPEKTEQAFTYTQNEMTELNCRILYTQMREGSIIPVNTFTAYDGYKNYQYPRIRGTYLLHQLRLKLGNVLFSKAMNNIHNVFAGKDITTDDFITSFEKVSGQKLRDFINQWIERDDILNLKTKEKFEPDNNGWKVTLNVEQINVPYDFYTTVSIKTEKGNVVKLIEVPEGKSSVIINVKDKPLQVTFNTGNDVPVERENFYTFLNFYDDFSSSQIIYGTGKQIEANHTLALRFAKTAADRFTEILLPVVKDCETNEAELKEHDLIVLGGIADNSLMKKISAQIGFEAGDGFFKWRGKTYNDSDDGIFMAIPNPFNNKHAAYLFYSNSSLQLYMMTKTLPRIPSFAIFKADQIVEKGY